MSNSKPLLGYHDLRGLAYPVKWALAYLGVDYEEKKYPLSQAGLEEYGAEKGNLGLDLPNLPYWKDGSINLTESRAILKYIARKEGNGVLMPSDPIVLAKAEMMENFLWDVWYFLVWRCFHDTEPFITSLKERGPPKWDMLHSFLGSNKFILGDKISYVDFMLYEMLYQYTLYDADYLERYPALLKYKSNFEEIPQIKKFIASPGYLKGPCYHPLFMKYKCQDLTV
ncbi:glutathione S-transferase Mu 1 [Folsomia candida]|uniref:glutathione transferase n=1 Tax=Folsomia candida TaxID=158441 RepID=A0A226EE58_FOLCA|nr:glutathione S-transferase Mu 1 [Folsomia candida]OXA55101.1 Glutathione S-transferase Mu 1 [Folsomia candida]